MCRVSIVVPVYNVEAYLAGCLESALGQTLCDIEVICVDDGSTDESPSILRAAAARDGRVRVVSVPNAGPSAARNRGMDAARGDIVMFLDADDALRPDACAVVSRVFGESDTDIVTFGARCLPEGAGGARLARCLSPRDARYDGFSPDILFKENARPYIWRSAFRRLFLDGQGLRFCEDLAFGEDQVFHFAAYPRARATVLLSDKLYDYRADRQGSLMDGSRKDDERRVRDHVAVIDHILADWDAQGWLDDYGAALLGWALEFTALDLRRLDDVSRKELTNSLRAVLQRRFDAGDVAALRPAERAMAREVMDARGGRTGRLALCRFYVERRGLRECVSRGLAAIGERMRR